MFNISLPQIGLTIVALLASLGFAPSSFAAQDDLAAWFPEQTCAFLMIQDVAEFEGKFKETDVGKAWWSDAMQAFRNELQESESKFARQMREAYGIDQEKLWAAASKRVAIGGIEVAGPSLSMSMLFEVEEADAKSLVADAKKTIESTGGRAIEVPFPVDAQIYERPDGEQLVYVVKDGFLLVSGDLGEATKIVQLWNGDKAVKSLASTEAYQNTVTSQAKDSPGEVHWFLDVIRLAVATAKKDEGETKEDPRGPFPTRHGFSGLRGIGGWAALTSDGFDFLNSIKILAPQPQGALAALDFQAGDTAARDFVPQSATTAFTIRWDVLSMFANIGDVYDDITDAPGAWAGTLDDWKSQLRFDLMGGMLPHLGLEIAMATDLNIEKNLERTITSIEIPDPGKERQVASSLYYFWRKDNKATRSKVPGHRNDLWQIRFSDDKGNTSFSGAGMMVANGRLWISTHASLIRDMLTGSAPQPLSSDPSYQNSLERMRPWTGDRTFARSFVRMDQDIRNTYEVLRTKGLGALKDVESLYSRGLLSILTKDGEVQDVKTDFSTLPPFDEIAPYLGVTSGVGNVESDGWSVTVGTFAK